MIGLQERREDVHPLVESVSRIVFQEAGSTQFLPDQCWDITFIRSRSGLIVLRTGLTTRPVHFDFEAGDENFSIAFKPQAFMPVMPGEYMRDKGVMLETFGPDRFHLDTGSFEIPRLDNVEDFIANLLSREAIISNPIVGAVAGGAPLAATERTVQRHFLKTTGLTLKTYSQIARARKAMSMLREGQVPAQVAAALDYADQSHLTRSLKTYMGMTPGQIAQASKLVPAQS